jgi:YD repeat-containing protein
MRQVSIIDVNGLQAIKEYDLKDRIISESVISDTKTITTTSVYDRDDRLVSQTDEIGNTTLYNYNNLNQLVEQIDANNIINLYKYDYRNKLISESREGREILYLYDIM